MNEWEREKERDRFEERQNLKRSQGFRVKEQGIGECLAGGKNTEKKQGNDRPRKLLRKKKESSEEANCTRKIYKGGNRNPLQQENYKNKRKI